MLLPRCSVNQLNSFSSADCSGYLVMADIALYEMLLTFFRYNVLLWKLESNIFILGK